MFKGVYTALITPFKESGEIDYQGFEKNIDFQISSGITGLLVLGTTGETPSLSSEEQEELIRITVKKSRGKTFVMVGTGTNDTAATVRKSVRAQELGADSVLVVTPYYNKPTNNGIIKHFEAVSREITIPVIVYNIQGRTGRNIDTPLMEKLSEIRGISGVKEASGNISQMSDVIERISLKKDFYVLSGDDGLTLPLMSIGGSGVISVISNVIPADVVLMVSQALNGDFSAARELHFNKIMPVTKAAFLETNPVPVKYIASRIGLCGGAYRLPMCEPETRTKEQIDKILQNLLMI